MIDHVIKKHVTLRAAAAIKAPEQRIIGDSTGGGRDAGDLRDGPWRSEVPLEQGPFLQAMSQWKGSSKDGAAPKPVRDEELHS